MSFVNLALRSKTNYDPYTKTWSGIKIDPIYGPDCSLGGVLLEHLRKNSEKIFQFCHHNGKTYTNGEIAKLAVQCAHNFKKHGVSQGDIIGIVASTTDFIAPVVYGAWLCGLIIYPMEPSTDMAIIRKINKQQNLTMIFTLATDYRRLKFCLDDLEINKTIYLLNENTDMIDDVREISEFFQETVDVNSFESVSLKNGGNQTAVILRSSGTTGTPKAICVSHTTLLHSFNYESEPDVLLGNCSIYWTTGLARLIYACMHGVPLVFNETGYSAKILPELIRKYKVTSAFISGGALPLLLDNENLNSADFSSLRQLLTGGMHIPTTLIKKAKALMPNATFYIVYGLSEVSGCGVSFGLANELSHSGQLVPRRELKIVDDEGKNLGPGEIGEICLRNEFPWAGYLDEPELTKAIYKDGWIHARDMGYVDEQGNLYICDRKSDILLCNGKVIYPKEIENIIYELPGILEVTVCGITDDKAGQLPAVAIRKALDCDLTEEEIYNYVAQRVGEEKYLRGGIYFVKLIPKTYTGKTLRFRCANDCEILRRSRFNDEIRGRS